MGRHAMGWRAIMRAEQIRARRRVVLWGVGWTGAAYGLWAALTWW